jgi:hypothetical protein
MQVELHIQNYSRSNDLLLAGNHSYLTYRPADARQIVLTRQNDGPEMCRRDELPSGAKLGANGMR